MAQTLWTIGHSTRTFDEFLELLRRHDIERIADVRSFPGSRKYPHFGQDALKDALKEHGVAYAWFKALGGRRRPRADSVNTAWRNESFRGYADYMETPEFKAALADLRVVSEEKRTAIMCAEAVWWRCHRSMIADQLCVQGVRVMHIMDDDHAVLHPMTSPARVVDGTLVYGAENGPA
ncbi:MAG TPA: DUF488 domain-containing protein [Burkholderiaceae bacterium]|nr:DUF488 domain-containing protein [Burkholderiaceae bacterium]